MALAAMAVYAGIAITDLLDGYLARKWEVVSEFGKLMDPIADKIYTLTLYGAFVLLNVISQWWVWPIIIREVTVTFARLIMVKRGLVIAAEKSGKIKAFVQTLSLFIVFIYFIAIRYFDIADSPFFSLLIIATYGVLVLAVYLTVRSGFDFFRNNWGMLFKQTKTRGGGPQ
jgi:CDP-diacylglycerol--glycerol-3-phosphate 3-phosphatidyltransferase